LLLVPVPEVPVEILSRLAITPSWLQVRDIRRTLLSDSPDFVRPGLRFRRMPR
jgi:hypothetical protein